MSVNVVILIGRLTRDPEVRTTQTGKQVANFSLAVNRRFKGNDGVDVDFFNCQVWGNTADFVSNYIGKGRLISIEGRLQTRKYTTQDGANREVVEVVGENVQALGPSPEQNGNQSQGHGQRDYGNHGGGQRPQQRQAESEDEYDPFAD